MKGENNMIIAIPYQNGEVFQHFGHTEQFKLYQVEEGSITQKMLIPTGGSGHSALAGLLSRLKVEALICGGIGGGAQAALAEAGIRVYGGVQGDADAAAQALASGTLQYDPNARCDHHDHEHEHTCGEHGCGEHSCH
jgi:predicted Fe-Mo cluster-binding NifX family protein